MSTKVDRRFPCSCYSVDQPRYYYVREVGSDALRVRHGENPEASRLFRDVGRPAGANSEFRQWLDDVHAHEAVLA